MGARSNIACLPHGAWKSRESRQTGKPKPPCCKWRKYGRAYPMRSKPQHEQDQTMTRRAGPRRDRGAID